MRKLIITEEEKTRIKTMYFNDLLGSREISKITGFKVSMILKKLKECGIPLRKSGRKYEGGVKLANKRYSENPEIKLRKKEFITEWSKENRDHLKKYHKQWRNNRIDIHRKNKRNYEKTRKSIDPQYKLISNFRTAIYIVLKENNMTKSGHYFTILGYSQKQLSSHLELLFKDGMTWENYGEWHVDHILPIVSFKFKDINDNEFKKCWSLENLRPLWGKENISKGCKI